MLIDVFKIGWKQNVLVAEHNRHFAYFQHVGAALLFELV